MTKYIAGRATILFKLGRRLLNLKSGNTVQKGKFYSWKYNLQNVVSVIALKFLHRI
jgi:hypothetical protein